MTKPTLSWRAAGWVLGALAVAAVPVFLVTSNVRWAFNEPLLYDYSFRPLQRERDNRHPGLGAATGGAGRLSTTGTRTRSRWTCGSTGSPCTPSAKSSTCMT